MERTYRKLSASEITQLEKNNCVSEDWSRIEVAENFSASNIRNVRFSGSVKIGNNVLIENVHNCISNYEIGDNTVIRNVDEIAVTEKTSFGNGVKVAVLDETGGREVIMYDKLSSHIAYIYAFYKYRPDLIKKLDSLIDNYVNSKESEIGIIGNDVLIENSGTINNVCIKDSSRISGASKLINGTICGSEIGTDVILEDFIVQSDSKISNGAKISRCFIGQACKIGTGFSAVDSLFFSNCHMENGEACALFAGPYTVSHHKSTLLIGAMFSFLNAGSGSNQSNHMYKLGPIHYGIGERGVKLASDSYIAHPSIIGAFSLVMGRHYSHPNTSIFPFSYLIENEACTYLAPGVAIATVGTIRDAQKWPVRDGRKNLERLDNISFSLLNPYICGKVIQAIHILSDIIDIQEDKSVYDYNDCKITNPALAKGLKLYNLLLDKYYGDILIKNIDNQNNISADGVGQWIDLGGLIAPKDEIDKLLENITDLDNLAQGFEKLLLNKKQFEWNWVLERIKEFDCKDVLKKWVTASCELNELILKDAKKEYTDVFKMTYGKDGDIDDEKSDFDMVRGGFEENTFIQNIRNQMTEDKQTYEKLISRL